MNDLSFVLATNCGRKGLCSHDQATPLEFTGGSHQVFDPQDYFQTLMTVDATRKLDSPRTLKSLGRAIMIGSAAPQLAVRCQLTCVVIESFAKAQTVVSLKSQTVISLTCRCTETKHVPAFMHKRSPDTHMLDYKHNRSLSLHGSTHTKINRWCSAKQVAHKHCAMPCRSRAFELQVW
jgi:hypothetical protein